MSRGVFADSQPAPGRRTSTVPSWTRTSSAGTGAVAGPEWTEPSVTRNALPCHGHTTQPSRSSPSCRGPARCGHTSERTRMSPSRRNARSGWSPSNRWTRPCSGTSSIRHSSAQPVGRRCGTCSPWLAPSACRNARWPPHSGGGQRGESSECRGSVHAAPTTSEQRGRGQHQTGRISCGMQQPGSLLLLMSVRPVGESRRHGGGRTDQPRSYQSSGRGGVRGPAAQIEQPGGSEETRRHLRECRMERVPHRNPSQQIANRRLPATGWTADVRRPETPSKRSQRSTLSRNLTMGFRDVTRALLPADEEA